MTENLPLNTDVNSSLFYMKIARLLERFRASGGVESYSGYGSDDLAELTCWC